MRTRLIPKALRQLAVVAAMACAFAAMAATEPSLPYTVKPKDKLIVMTRELLKNPSDWGEVARINGLKDPNFIKPGQTLQIPLRMMKYQGATGRVVSASGDVQRAGAKLNAGDAVAEGDKLQTAAESSAVVELGDGSRVQLLPNSLVEVIANRTYAMPEPGASKSTNWFSGLIRLAQGTIDTLAAKGAQRAEPLRIQTATSTLGVRGTQFRVAVDDPAGQVSRAEVIEGLVQAGNDTQKTNAELPGGSGAVIRASERVITPVKLLPAPDLAALPADLARPAGNWPMPTLGGATAYRVQVASDDRFEKIVRDLKVTQASVDLGGLDVGNWFARIRGIDAQGLEGFDAVKLIRIMAPQPAGTLRVSYASASVVNGQTVLTWSGEMSDGTALAQQGLQREVLGDASPGARTVRLQGKTADGRTVEAQYQLTLPANWGTTVFDMIVPLEPSRR